MNDFLVPFVKTLGSPVWKGEKFSLGAETAAPHTESETGQR